MGLTLSAVQNTALTKFAGPTAIPHREIQATVFDPLGQVNWRAVDISAPACTEALDLLLVHSSETHHIPMLFGYVARLLDGVSASATAGSLEKHGRGSGGGSSSSVNSSHSGAANNNSPNHPSSGGGGGNGRPLSPPVGGLVSGSSSTAGQTATTSTSKESAAQLLRTTHLTRLAALLLFNSVQRCAGNPFALLRLTNSPNEEAMTMLGAAAELVVRVPFSTSTAALHVEATELLRFACSTRLYGTGLTTAASEAGVGGTMLASSSTTTAMTGASAASVASSTTRGGGSMMSDENNGGDGDSRGSSSVVVRDPFLRRLALGQRADAILTKALVHVLLQRICVWASVLRGTTRPSVMILHQKVEMDASAAAAGGSISTFNPHITAPSGSAQSQQQQQAPAGGWGTKMYGWIFGAQQQQQQQQQQGGGVASSSGVAQPSTASTASSSSHSSGGAPYPAAGLSSTGTAAEVLAGVSSLHVLLCLLFFNRGAGKASNTAVDVIKQLRGIDEFAGGAGIESTSTPTASTPTTTGGGPMISPILGGEWPLELVEAIATLIPSHLEATLLLYSLLTDCQSFARSVASSSSSRRRQSSAGNNSSNNLLHMQLAHLTVDMLRPAVERPASPESLFLAVVVSQLARIDGVARAFFSERLRAVPAYFLQEGHYVSGSSLSVGAFVTLAVTRIIFRASMGDGQASVGAAWLSALVNLSPFAVNLDTAVEQKLVTLFLALLRRVARLRNEIKNSPDGTAFFATAQLDTAYAHLDIIGTAVFQMVADPQRNPTLLYELLYHRDKVSQVTSSWTEGDAVWRALKPVTFILDKIEADLSSMKERPRSIPGILEVIRFVGRDALREPSGGGAAAVVVAADGSTVDHHEAPGGGHVPQQSVRVTLHEQGSEAGVKFPKVTMLGAEEEVSVTSYDFCEETAFGGGGGYSSDQGDTLDGATGGGGVCEPFFATILWHCVLQTDGLVEPPGCLKNALGHGEVFPIFRTKR